MSSYYLKIVGDYRPHFNATPLTNDFDVIINVLLYLRCPHFLVFIKHTIHVRLSCNFNDRIEKKHQRVDDCLDIENLVWIL